MGIEGTHFNITKVAFGKLTANTIHNRGKNRKPFPLRSETSQGHPLSPLLFNSVQKFQPGQLGKRKKEIGKEEAKLPLFVDDMTICIENPEDQVKNISTNISIQQEAEYKINME